MAVLFDTQSVDDASGAALQQAIQSALNILGGVIKPTDEALRALGWPRCTKQAIAARRRDGTLPVHEMKLGGRYFVTAEAVAEAFLMPHGAAAEAPAHATPHRRPGRPRKAEQIAARRAANAGEG